MEDKSFLNRYILIDISYKIFFDFLFSKREILFEEIQ